MSQEESSFTSPRGMRDFYPEDMALRNSIFTAWRTAALRSGFQEYDACVVESLDLLKRKAGEEIVEQIYTFLDKSGRELALRPEMTPTLARMVAARQGALNFPLKWFTIAQCFRYERMSRGRKREHYQWNLDIIGENSVSAEAEVITTAVNALSLSGLTSRDLLIHYNSRSLLADLLQKLGINQEHHAQTFLALDKRGKIPDTEITSTLKASGLDDESIRKVFSLLNIQSLEQTLQLLGGETPAYKELLQFLKIIESYGLSDILKYDISVIRGLSYYTGIVFEAFDVNRKFRAIFGGGRYNNLLGDIGGKPVSAVGLGFGDVVIAEALADARKTPAAPASADTAIGFMTDEQQLTAVSITDSLRKSGKKVDLALHSEKAKSFFGRAGKSGCTEAIYIGPDDIASQKVRIKNMTDRTERETALSELCRQA